MNRAEVLHQIEICLAGCQLCPRRRELESQYGKDGRYAKIDGVCNRECPVGSQLQKLGRQLVKPQRTYSGPRLQRREWMLS